MLPARRQQKKKAVIQPPLSHAGFNRGGFE